MARHVGEVRGTGEAPRPVRDRSRVSRRPRHLDDETARGALEPLVTPESRHAWGDFSAAAAGPQAIVASPPKRLPDARDVAYVTVLPHVAEGFRSTAEQDVEAAFLTVVWRPEYGGRQIHSAGEPIRPDDLPRTSPDDAP